MFNGKHVADVNEESDANVCLGAFVRVSDR